MRKTLRGFTLIELMVAMAVMAIGFTILTAYFSGIQQKSRDARRMSDVNEIVKALNIYYAGFSRFPVVASEVIIDSSDSFSSALEGDGAIKETPKDPQHPHLTYRYVSTANGASYTLKFCLETNKIQGYSAGCDNTKTP